MDIDEILGKARLPESSVTLCLAADLQGQWETLQEQLDTASTVALSLGEISEAKRIAAQMEALREQMSASRATFKLRALEEKGWRQLFNARPEEGRTEEERAGYDDRFHDWVCKLLAATCYDPAMTPAQADQLAGKLSGGQWKLLVDAAYDLNTGRRDVPFSSAASALTRPYEQNSKRQEPGESPTADGSAAGRVKKPSTATTSKDG